MSYHHRDPIKMWSAACSMSWNRDGSCRIPDDPFQVKRFRVSALLNAPRPYDEEIEGESTEYKIARKRRESSWLGLASERNVARGRACWHRVSIMRAYSARLYARSDWNRSAYAYSACVAEIYVASRRRQFENSFCFRCCHADFSWLYERLIYDWITEGHFEYM